MQRPTDNAAEILDEIASVTPQYGGISFARLENGGLQWPCPNADHPGTKFLHKGTFARGKGLFKPAEYIPSAELPDAELPIHPDHWQDPLPLPYQNHDREGGWS